MVTHSRFLGLGRHDIARRVNTAQKHNYDSERRVLEGGPHLGISNTWHCLAEPSIASKSNLPPSDGAYVGGHCHWHRGTSNPTAEISLTFSWRVEKSHSKKRRQQLGRNKELSARRQSAPQLSVPFPLNLGLPANCGSGLSHFILLVIVPCLDPQSL